MIAVARYAFAKAALLSADLQHFVDVAVALSPENLSCDGELPARRVAAKRFALHRQCAALEAKVGREVTEDEVWDRFMAERDAAELLAAATPGELAGETA